MAPAALLAKRRQKTTTLIHHGQVQTKPRDLQARVLSPTRRHNPQPLGLVYQSPLHSNAQVGQGANLINHLVLHSPLVIFLLINL